jgi:transposase-like protein
MPRSRRPNFTPEQKLKILRLHLLEKRPVSDLCDEFDFRPSQFHDWQKAFFENGAAAFARDNGDAEKAQLRRTIEALESRVTQKNEVIAELTEALVGAKKKPGAS